MDPDEVSEANAALDLKEKHDKEKWVSIINKVVGSLFQKKRK